MIVIYTIKTGDTLSSIAKKYNTTVEKIVKDNKIQNKNLIFTGQKLTISTNVSTSDSDLKTALKNCLTDIEKLPSFQRLKGLL